MTEPEYQCDGSFLEEMERRWEYEHVIDAVKIPRLLGIAKRCQSVQ